MSKDLGLAEQAIDLTGVDARMGRLAREIYREFADGAGAGQDFSGIINTIRAESRAAGACPKRRPHSRQALGPLGSPALATRLS